LGLFWVCIGFDWVCIGFVFWEPKGDFIFIILCEKAGYIHFGLKEIGFVLQNLLFLIERTATEDTEK